MHGDIGFDFRSKLLEQPRPLGCRGFEGIYDSPPQHRIRWGKQYAGLKIFGIQALNII